MIRKLITTLLCLLLTAALPLAALADTQHELEIIPGDAIAALPPVPAEVAQVAQTVVGDDGAMLDPVPGARPRVPQRRDIGQHREPGKQDDGRIGGNQHVPHIDRLQDDQQGG